MEKTAGSNLALRPRVKSRFCKFDGNWIYMCYMMLITQFVLCRYSFLPKNCRSLSKCIKPCVRFRRNWLHRFFLLWNDYISVECPYMICFRFFPIFTRRSRDSTVNKTPTDNFFITRLESDTRGMLSFKGDSLKSKVSSSIYKMKINPTSNSVTVRKNITGHLTINPLTLNLSSLSPTLRCIDSVLILTHSNVSPKNSQWRKIKM